MPSLVVGFHQHSEGDTCLVLNSAGGTEGELSLWSEFPNGVTALACCALANKLDVGLDARRACQVHLCVRICVHSTRIDDGNLAELGLEPLFDGKV